MGIPVVQVKSAGGRQLGVSDERILSFGRASIK